MTTAIPQGSIGNRFSVIRRYEPARTKKHPATAGQRRLGHVVENCEAYDERFRPGLRQAGGESLDELRILSGQAADSDGTGLTTTSDTLKTSAASQLFQLWAEERAWRGSQMRRGDKNGVFAIRVTTNGNPRSLLPCIFLPFGLNYP